MFSLGLHFGFGFMVAIVIVYLIDSLWDWVKKPYRNRKKLSENRYFFLSYVGLNNSNQWVVGHALIYGENCTLSVISKKIQKENNFKNPATISFFKELSKDEYENLSE